MFSYNVFKGGGVILDFASIIKQGEKDYTSDFFKICEGDSCYCFAISDGRENYEAAQKAVSIAAENFSETEAVTKASLPDFFNNANNALLKEEMPVSASMALLLTDGSVAIWGSIGDCRIYLLRDNWLYEITPDHSDAYSLYEAGEIRYPKIRKSNTRYTLTRVLGRDSEISPNISQPEVLRKGDSFLICTDGFWENIHERQIEKTLKRSKSAQNWLDRMMKIIDKNIKHKKYTGFKDSLCAVTIKL